MPATPDRVNAKRVISAAEVTLGLLGGHKSYQPGIAYERLARLVQELCDRAGLDFSTSTTITTTADTGTYKLTEIADIDRIITAIWPTEWIFPNAEGYAHTFGSDITGDIEILPHGGPRHVHRNELFSWQQYVTAYGSSGGSAPVIWTHYRDGDGNMTVVFADSATIADGLTVTFHVEKVVYAAVTRGTDIPLDPCYETYLEHKLCASLALIYAPDRAVLFDQLAERRFEEIRVDHGFTDHTEPRTMNVNWYPRGCND